ncbi:MAG: class I SAM-dependent methyltransferase [Planctomycetota bacterium]
MSSSPSTSPPTTTPPPAAPPAQDPAAFDDAPWRRTAVSVIRALPEFPGVDVLELGCGDGLVLEALRHSGANARGTTFRSRDDDYIRKRDHPEDLPIDHGVDLNVPIPYDDASFDVVVSTEVIEHLDNHRNFVTEALRVLRPGGVFVLTSVNLHRLPSRLAFFLTGTHLMKHRLITESVALSRMEEFHHRCVDFPLLHWLIWQNGGRIEAMTETHVQTASKVLGVFAPLLGPLVRKSVWRHRRDAPDDEAYRRDLYRCLTDRSLARSEQFCLTIRKARA